MPIFHDYLEPESSRNSYEQTASIWSQGAETSNGGFAASLNNDLNMTSPLQSPRTAKGDYEAAAEYRRLSMLDRAELIERIKRENNPSWQQSRSASPSTDSKKERSRHEWRRPAQTQTPTIFNGSNSNPATTLGSRPQPPEEQRNLRRSTSPTSLFFGEQATAGLHIQRPSSALHRGDFNEKKVEDAADKSSSNPGAIFATSPVVPWHPSFPAAADPSNRPGSPHPGQANGDLQRAVHAGRARAISQLTLSSPFVFMPPTTPLVQQSNNSDLEFPTRWETSQSSRSPEPSNRRHTFSPSSFQPFQSMKSPKREGQPCQAHQPRRSIVSMNQFQAQSTPQTPLMQPRRPSISDASPLHHAPMVGSYEESILRGRMSTTPSRPLNFIARIGVMGRGNCKESLRCPPHVTVPFPAVFYSYNGGNTRLTDNSPSPYVGLVDLENGLEPPKEVPRARRKRRHVSPASAPGHSDIASGPPKSGALNDVEALKEKTRRREKSKRRSASPKAPPGGCYRIPQQGQIQIVIKNPNQTAVKLFLIPYDLSAMEPGQKTFIRQRSYSAGSVIDMPISCRNNLGTDRPEASLSNSDDPRDRPILRYLVHLHICCPAKGRFYLYKSIRVVFANRVPDGKETLRNETQLPDPPYSAYKPSRDCVTSHPTTPTAAQLAENTTRRESIGHALLSQPLERLNGYNPRPPPPPPAVQLTGASYQTHSVTMNPLPYDLVSKADAYSALGEQIHYTRHVPPTPAHAPSFQTSPEPSMGSFTKLKRGEAGYGGNNYGGVGSPAESLLAKKLRGLPLEDEEMGS